MKSHLFILSFMSLALGDTSVKILLHGMSETFLLMSSSRTFIVSPLIFKSFIHEIEEEIKKFLEKMKMNSQQSKTYGTQQRLS